MEDGRIHQRSFRIVMWTVLGLLIVTSLAGLVVEKEFHLEASKWVIGTVIFSPLVLLIATGIGFLRRRQFSLALAIIAILVIIALSIAVGLK